MNGILQKGETNENVLVVQLKLNLLMVLSSMLYCKYVCMYGCIMVENKKANVLIDLLKIESGQFLKKNYD